MGDSKKKVEKYSPINEDENDEGDEEEDDHYSSSRFDDSSSSRINSKRGGGGSSGKKRFKRGGVESSLISNSGSVSTSNPVASQFSKQVAEFLKQGAGASNSVINDEESEEEEDSDAKPVLKAGA
jgi:hypothetical protein